VAAAGASVVECVIEIAVVVAAHGATGSEPADHASRTRRMDGRLTHEPHLDELPDHRRHRDASLRGYAPEHADLGLGQLYLRSDHDTMML
jgi:hypothetical protein